MANPVIEDFRCGWLMVGTTVDGVQADASAALRRAPYRLRPGSAELAEALGVCDGVVQDIEVALTEACTNVLLTAGVAGTLCIRGVVERGGGFEADARGHGPATRRLRTAAGSSSCANGLQISPDKKDFQNCKKSAWATFSVGSGVASGTEHAIATVMSDKRDGTSHTTSSFTLRVSRGVLTTVLSLPPAAASVVY